jgi:hypothetical protein
VPLREEWDAERGQLMSSGGDGRPVARHVTFADDVGMAQIDSGGVGYTTLSERIGVGASNAAAAATTSAAAAAAAVEFEGHSSSLVQIPPAASSCPKCCGAHTVSQLTQNLISLISSLHTSSSSPNVSSGTAWRERGADGSKGSVDMSSSSWEKGVGSTSWADDLLERTLRWALALATCDILI